MIVTTEKDNILEIIDDLIKKNDVILFMKGKKDMPMCGFSNFVAQVLKNLNIDFVDVNVLEDDSMRQGIKEYTDWPTLPQLYVKGQFIGGCDIVKQMLDSGELESLLKEKGIL